ncbi:MAG: LecA/PA-IL family lectin [Vicinamibacterales bacterium]
MVPQRWIAGLAITLALTASVQADTLYLRDGSRVQGELISVRNDTVEFEERRSYGSGRTLRLDRDEVVRIEFETARRGGGNDFLVGGRPSGMRERQTIVSADVAWNDSGIDVRAGQTIYFESQGQVRWGRDRRDGPAGERNSPSNPNRPMGNRNAAALIGKIGSGNDLFFIGDETGPVRVRTGGRLYLGINDDVLTDNSGNFRVVVHY